VNNLRTPGRWAFAELTEIYRIDADFKAKIEREFRHHDRARRPRAD
jgi:type III restriction enzyme